MSLRQRVSALGIAIVVCLAARPARGQITNLSDVSSTPIPGAGHNYLGELNETVNPANGSVSLRISVPMPKGRGLTVPFAFAYDSNGTPYPQPDSLAGVYWTVGDAEYGLGWTYIAPTLSLTTEDITLTDGTQSVCRVALNYMYNDPTAGRHQLGLSIYGYAPGGHRGGGDCSTATLPNGSPIGGQFTSGGDSVLQASTTAIPSGNNFWLQPVSIIESDGTVVNFQTSGTSDGRFVAAKLEESNGNVVTVNGGPLTFSGYTDTLGRQALSIGYGGSFNTPHTDTLTASGMGASYYANWSGSVTVKNNGLNLTQYSGSCTVSGANLPFVPLSSLELPDGKSYDFYYDSAYGVINKIVYPTGAYVRYVWGVNAKSEAGYSHGTDSNGNAFGCSYYFDTPVIIDRYVSFDGSTEVLHQHFAYSTTWQTGQNAGRWSSKSTTVTTYDLLRGTNFQTVYTYSPIFAPSQPNTGVLITNQIPVESSIQYYGTDGSLLRTVNKAWGNQYAPACVSTTQGSLTSRTNFTYRTDVPFGGDTMLTDKKEWDWGQAPACGTSASGTPLRETQIQYASLGSAILDKPSQVTVYGSGTQAAQTTYAYSQSVTAAGETVGRDANYNGNSGIPRGNASQVCRWLNTTGGSLCDSLAYDDTGQALSKTDPLNNTTNFSYSSSYYGAYMTQVTYPTTNGVQHKESFTWDLAAGELASSVDENSQTTSFTYDDPFARLTQTDYPDTGQTSLSYSDAGPTPSVVRTKALGSAGSLVTTGYTDGLAHPIQSVLNSDPAGAGQVVTTLDGMARAWKVTNPYRSTSDPTYGISQYTYDSLGRVTLITRPDGNTVNSSHSGNSVTVTDEAGKVRETFTDALGRTTKVIEDPNGLNYETDYTLDALDNLLKVTQGNQTRTFVYDSLSRLTSATNPESGAASYTYDANGNVFTRTAPKPNQTSSSVTVTTTYSYDALNRLLSKTYNDGATPSVSYTYDQTACLGASSCYNIGRRTSMTDGAGSEAWSYDPMGRMLVDQRTTKGVTETLPYSWNLDGTPQTQPFAAGGYESFSYNSAGQATQAVGSGGYDWALSATYEPNGALASTLNGKTSSFAGITETLGYNNRLWPASVVVSSSNGTALSLAYSYFPNGNMHVITNNVDGGRTATYTYDSLNRVTSGKSTATTGADCWGQSIPTGGYDRYGNLSTINASQTGSGCSQPTLNLSISGTTNQVTSGGFKYDAAGNMLTDGIYTYTWDAEGRQTSAEYMNTTPVLYFYDGNGQRVEKCTQGSQAGTCATSPPGTLFWHDLEGQVMTETDASGGYLQHYIFLGGRRFGAVGPNDAYLFYSDNLGSVRVITGETGLVCYSADFYPFGGEKVLTNNCPQPYYPFKFAAMERDSETGNDHTQNRQYSSTYGRWLSPDPAGKKAATLLDPQTWNMYSYVRDNPLTLADPGGLEPQEPPGPEGRVNCTNENADKCQGNKTTDQDTVTQEQVNQTVVNAVFSILIAIDPLITMGGGAAEGEGEEAAGATNGAEAEESSVVESTTAASARESEAAAPAVPYQRPANATTAEQRAAVQGQPCVTCGATGQKNYADHKEPLVVEYYRTGTINTERMRSVNAVQPQCPTCSNAQGGALSTFSRLMKWFITNAD